VLAGTPAFNEEKTIANVVVRTMRSVDKVVVVDDGSTDDTAMNAEALGANVIKHGRNLGYGAAIRSCFEAAGGLKADMLVTLNGDGQHDREIVDTISFLERNRALADHLGSNGRNAFRERYSWSYSARTLISCHNSMPGSST
jgi:glycosyltransferase involved in cell wall biosynthesis